MGLLCVDEGGGFNRERIVEAGAGIGGQMAQGLLKIGFCFRIFPFLLVSGAPGGAQH